MDHEARVALLGRTSSDCREWKNANEETLETFERDAPAAQRVSVGGRARGGQVFGADKQ